MLGQRQVIPWTVTSLVLVSRELLNAAPNVGDLVNAQLAADMASKIDDYALTGTGAGQPMGIRNAGILTYEMGTNGDSLDWDHLLSARGDLMAADAPEPKALILAARDEETLSKLKDGNSNYIVRPPALANLRLLPTTKIDTTETQGTASGVCSSAYLGDFSEVALAFRSRVRIEVLKERFVDTFQVGFLAYAFVDVIVFRPSALIRLYGITA